MTLKRGSGSTVVDVPTFSIGRLADSVGVSVETVRYYERRGLIDQPQRTGSGYRQYTAADIDRLEFLLRAKELGFTLTEIAELFSETASRSPGDITRAVQRKLDAIEMQLEDLRALRCRLRRLIQLCEHGDHEACLALQVAS